MNKTKQIKLPNNNQKLYQTKSKKKPTLTPKALSRKTLQPVQRLGLNWTTLNAHTPLVEVCHVNYNNTLYSTTAQSLELQVFPKGHMTNTWQFVKAYNKKISKIVTLFFFSSKYIGRWSCMLAWKSYHKKDETTGTLLGAESVWVLGKSSARTAAEAGQKGRRKLVEIWFLFSSSHSYWQQCKVPLTLPRRYTKITEALSTYECRPAVNKLAQVLEQSNSTTVVEPV